MRTDRLIVKGFDGYTVYEMGANPYRIDQYGNELNTVNAFVTTIEAEVSNGAYEGWWVNTTTNGSTFFPIHTVQSYSVNSVQ